MVQYEVQGRQRSVEEKRKKKKREKGDLETNAIVRKMQQKKKACETAALLRDFNTKGAAIKVIQCYVFCIRHCLFSFLLCNVDVPHLDDMRS
jgi:hypothetical protein